jgi:hypothetical protein
MLEISIYFLEKNKLLNYFKFQSSNSGISVNTFSSREATPIDERLRKYAERKARIEAEWSDKDEEHDQTMKEGAEKENVNEEKEDKVKHTGGKMPIFGSTFRQRAPNFSNFPPVHDDKVSC